MPLELTKPETQEVIASLRRYFRDELDEEIGDMKAGFLLEYIMKEIAPLAYNRGVQDAETFLRQRLEDLPSVCFEEGLSFWRSKRK